MQKITSSLLAALLVTSTLFSQQAAPAAPAKDPAKTLAQGDIDLGSRRSPDADDMEALRRWIRDKRMVTVKEIGGDLALSGDVRAEFQGYSEVKDGIRQRGDGGAFPNKAQYVWDVEVNLMIDYRTDRTWAAIKIEFDNDMGITSGTARNIRLEKGYLGGRVVPGDTFNMDAEIGRRYLINVFESKLEYGSLFDGVLFRFAKAFEGIGDFYSNIGALLVNDKTNHYAYVGEIGGLRIGNSGANVKYSVIDWYKPAANELQNLRYKYLVSQLLGYYQCFPEWIGKKMVKIYGAGLVNHLAGPVEQTGYKKQNWAWYAGVSLGMIKKQYDWAIDANCQWVQAQSIPEYDCIGIGRGNSAGVGFYAVDPAAANPVMTTQKTAVGSCNFKGFELEGTYAVTDNMTVYQTFKWSTTLNKNIGPDLHYKQYEIEFIYAF